MLESTDPDDWQVQKEELDIITMGLATISKTCLVKHVAVYSRPFAAVYVIHGATETKEWIVTKISAQVTKCQCYIH